MAPSKNDGKILARVLHHKALFVVAGLLILTLLAAWAPVAVAGPQYVIEISIDGGGASYIQNLINSNSLPNFKKFVTEGSTTFNARTDFDWTVTLMNHTSMITGRGVEGATGHNWTYNADPSSVPTDSLYSIQNNKGSYVASVFDVAHDNGLRTSLYSTKSKFSLYDHSYNNNNGAVDTTGVDNGRNKIDVVDIDGNSATMTSSFLAAMAANPYNFSFVHYGDPDAAGHASGWGSTAYNNALIGIDSYLGSIFNLVNTNSALQGKTAILLTADHGGTGTDHSTITDPLDYTIPFFAWGAGVQASADLYALNPSTRLNPGTGRPDYSAAVQPIRNGEMANAGLKLLGLGPVPGSTINSSQNLSTYLAASYTGATYSENFNSLGLSGTVLPNGWSVVDMAGGNGDVSVAPFPTVRVATGTISTPALLSWNFAQNGSVTLSGVANGGASNTDTDRCLVTSATGLAAKGVQLILSNSSGSPIQSGQFSYQMKEWGTAVEELPGYTFFYSLTGGTNASDWTPVDGLRATTAGTVTANINFGTTPLASGSNVWFRWVDDNAAASPDRAYGIDNVTFQRLALRTITWNATNGTWNATSGNQPWSDGANATEFQAGDKVVFNQSAGGAVAVDAAGISATEVNFAHPSGTYSFSGGPIGGNLTKSGGGTVVFQSPNSFSSASITGGTVETQVSGALGSGTVTLDGGTWKASATQTSSNPVTVGANGGTLEVTAGNQITMSQTISGTGSLTKAGDGVLLIDSAESYAGTTSITGGTLRLSPASSLPASVSGNLVARLDASSLGLANGAAVTSVTNGASAGSAGAFIVASGSPTYNAAGLNGKGTINFNAAGLRTTNNIGISGNTANSFSMFSVMRRNGDTTSGVMAVQLGGGGTYSGMGITDQFNGLWAPYTIGQGGVQPSNDQRTAGAWDLIDTIHQHGTPTATAGTHWGYVNGTLLGTNSNDGDINIADNPLYIGAGPAISQSNGDIAEVLVYNTNLSDTDRKAVESYLNYKWFGVGRSNLLPITTSVSIASGSALDLADCSQILAGISGSGSITLGKGTLTINGTADSSFAGGISGTGGLVKSGASRLTLSGANGYTGPTMVSGGTLEGNTASIPTAISLSNNANVTFNQTTNATYALAISGTGSFTKSGNAKLTLTAAANTYSGPTTITGGTLEGSTATIPTAVTLSNGANVTFNQTSDATFAQTVSGSGSLTKSGNSVLTIGSGASYTGPTTINGGTLRLAAQSAPVAPVAGSLVWIDASTLGLADGATVTGMANAGSGGSIYDMVAQTGSGTDPLPTMSIDGSGKKSIRFVGGLNGLKTASNLAITGDASRTIFAVMSFNTGRISLSTGVGPATDGTFGIETAPDFLNFFQNNDDIGKTYDPAAHSDAVGPRRTSNVLETYEMTHDTTTHLTSAYVDNGLFGTKTATLVTGSAPMTIGINGWGYADGKMSEILIYNSLLSDAQRGQVEAYLNYKWYGIAPASNDILPTSTSVAIASGSTLDLNGVNQTVAGLSGQGTVALGSTNNVLTVNSTADTTFAGSIGGAGSLVKTGTASLFLSGSNSFTGGTTVSAGLLEIDSAGALPGGSLTIGQNGTVVLGSSLTQAVRISRLSFLTGLSSLSSSEAGSLSVVPEPGTMALLAAGSVLLTAVGWRRRKRANRDY